MRFLLGAVRGDQDVLEHLSSCLTAFIGVGLTTLALASFLEDRTLSRPGQNRKEMSQGRTLERLSLQPKQLSIL